MFECSSSDWSHVFSPLRVSRAPDSHQHVPAKASGKWLVQPASCEAETENNGDCAALPQQTTGAWVLHLTLPWGWRGKASPLMPISPVPTLAHKCTLQRTHIHPHIITHHLQMCVVYTHIHTESLYLYCTVLLFIWLHISTLSAFDSKSKVSKIMPRWEKATFLCCSC